jgi:RNA polymerase-binding transcription factor DksA
MDYQTKLTHLLDEVTLELKAIGIHNPQNKADWIAVPEGVDANQSDSDLLADVIEEWDERASLVATLEHQYNDITRALAKLKEGTFGVCEIGGEHIEEDRLGANPAARTCKAHMNDEGSLTS